MMDRATHNPKVDKIRILIINSRSDITFIIPCKKFRQVRGFLFCMKRSNTMAKNSQKVLFNDKQYFVVEEAGQSVRLTNGTESFIVLKSKTKPIKEKKNVQKQEVAEAEESGTGER